MKYAGWWNGMTLPEKIFAVFAAVWFPTYIAVNVHAAVTPNPWPPIPTTVRGLGGPITVRVIASPKDEDGAELWGSWEQHTRTIEIDAGAPLPFQHHTLFHELCHSTLGDSGLVNLIEEKQAEALCDAHAAGRIQEMRGTLGLPE